MKLLADENFDGRVIRGLLTRTPRLDLVRAVDVGLSGADDPAILEWTANAGRVLLTHDVSTMVGFAYDRVSAGQPMPGVVEVPTDISLGLAIDDILLLVGASLPNEWEGQVLYMPL